ncbi:MAG TPA: L-lactate permease, partial [Armatimonadota bacterium]|nr:L-lactate permease [Armatimonadota bacterium]
SPVLGWIGVFITGSDTSANALFGNLQASAAREIGMDPVLAVAANTTGGVTGKMISPQSIAVATAAVGLAGRESEILRRTVWHSLAFLLAISVLTYLQASLLPGLAALVPLFPAAWPLGAGGWLVLAGFGTWRRK